MSIMLVQVGIQKQLSILQYLHKGKELGVGGGGGGATGPHLHDDGGHSFACPYHATPFVKQAGRLR